MQRGASTPLHIAASRGYTEMCARLLDHGADLHARTKVTVAETRTTIGIVPIVLSFLGLTYRCRSTEPEFSCHVILAASVFMCVASRCLRSLKRVASRPFCRLCTMVA